MAERSISENGVKPDWWYQTVQGQISGGDKPKYTRPYVAGDLAGRIKSPGNK